MKIQSTKILMLLLCPKIVIRLIVIIDFKILSLFDLFTFLLAIPHTSYIEYICSLLIVNVFEQRIPNVLTLVTVKTILSSK